MPTAKPPTVVERVASPAKLRAAHARLCKRERRRVSQGEVAERAGILRPQLARLLAGRQLNCKVGQLSRLAATYGCGVDDLLDVPSGKVVDPDGLVV
jgi:DNA-binding Xre family transcriptional regulator